MYKRDRFIFVSNLKDVTCDPKNPLTLKRDAYLLSEHYSNDKMIERAKYARSKRNLIVSDNGNFSRMRKISEKHSQKGKEILSMAKDKMDSTVLEKRLSLIETISLDCIDLLENQDKTGIVDTQLKIRPHIL
jgi:hypothetical protein